MRKDSGNSGRGSRYLALCGGVGGAKLVLGLARALAPEALTVVVNTGDDFEHLGLTICPDIDTVTYTLAGLADPIRGWGRADDSWAALDELKRLGGQAWFQLGDKDLGLHLARRDLLDAAVSLSEVTKRIARSLGVDHEIAPMTDGTVRTMIDTDTGPMPFQHYFVRERCAPVARRIQYAGAADCSPSPTLRRALSDPDLAAVIICPSNPYLSIDPILAVPGVRDSLRRAHAPVIAVAPIVGGRAIKGPTAKIMRELGMTPSAAAVAHHYADVLDGYVIDSIDAGAVGEMSSQLKLLACNIVMKTFDDKVNVAYRCLDFAADLRARK